MLYRIQHLDLPDRPFFVLSADGTLTADFNSTLFNQQSELLGSYSYPGTMPLEPNRALIRNAQYINTSNKSRTINAMMWVGNIPFKQVKMYFTIELDKGSEMINYNLYYDLAFISTQLKTLKLWQLIDAANWGQLTFDEAHTLADYMTATTTGTKGQYPMVFYPFKNDGAYIDAAYELEPLYSSSVVYTAGQKFTFTNLHIYEVTATTTAGQTPVTNPEKFNDLSATYPDSAFPASQIINRWELADDATSSFILDAAGVPVRQTIMPAFYLVYVIKRICQYFGFTPTGDWLDDDFANKITIWSNVPVNAGIVTDYTYYMPDISVSEFFKSIRTEFGLLIELDPLRGVWVIESIANLETKSDIVDLQGVQTVSYRETDNQSQAFIITQGFDDKDSAFSDAEKKSPPQILIGDVNNSVQQTTITIASVITKMIQESVATPIYDTTTALAATWRIPYIKMPVAGATPMDQISKISFSERNSFGLRFLIYWGIQLNDAGYGYPYASNDALGISGTGTLALNDLSGAIPSIVDFYQYILNSKPFEMVFELWPWQFALIASNKRVIVKDKNYTAVSCLIDQNAVDFTNNKEKLVAKLTLYPRIWPDNAAEVLPPIVPPPTPPPFDNGTVFVRMGRRNPTTFTSPIPPHYTTHQLDVYVQFFEDSAHTIPKDVTNLMVRYKWDTFIESALQSSRFVDVNCTSTPGSHEFTIYANAPNDSFQGAGQHYAWVYTIEPTADYSVLTPLPYP